LFLQGVAAEHAGRLYDGLFVAVVLRIVEFILFANYLTFCFCLHSCGRNIVMVWRSN